MTIATAPIIETQPLLLDVSNLTGRQVAWKVDGEGSLDKSLEKR
jgi:hypothetical protein